MRFASVLLTTLLTISGLTAGSTRGSGHVTAQQGPSNQVLFWSAGSPSPILRAEAEGAAIGEQLFVFGGYSYPLNGFSPYSRVDVFDVTRNEWTRRRDLPRPVNHAGVAADGTVVYIAGGYVANASTSGAVFGTREVWNYDTTADSYTAMPPLPVARAAGQLVLLGRELHYFGGANLERTVDSGDHWALNLDASATGWQRRAALPNPRNHLGAVALNGAIYAVGGQHSHDAALTTQRDVHRYNPQTDRWTAVAPLPAVVVGGASYGRGHIAASTFVRNGKIVVAGGEYRHMHPVRDVVEYDPQTNRWTALAPLPVARYSGVAHQFGSTFVYATGGDENAQFTNTTWLGCTDTGVATPPSARDYCAVHSPTPSAVRINAGGYAQSVSGVGWSACRDVAGCEGRISGGKRYTYSPAPAVGGVTSPANEALYQSEWTGDVAANVQAGGVAFSFNVPVVRGAYRIRLHFAENYQNAAGTRTFDVNLEGGSKELTNFDVYAQAGGKNRSIVREFPITVSDGVVTIEFIRQVQQPFVNAVEVLPVATPPQPTTEPTATPTTEPTAIPTTDPTATLTRTPTPQSTVVPTVTPSSQPTVVPTALPPGTSTVRINTGGYAQTVDGTTWSACRDTAGCNGWVSGGKRYTHSPAPAVTGVVAPANLAVYQAEWTEDAAAKIPPGGVAFAFDVPVADGTYTVRLHFAENYQAAAGARTFDVNLEGGATELTALDVYAAAGGKSRAIVRALPVTVDDGMLSIQFIKRDAQPFVNGIEVVPGDG